MSEVSTMERVIRSDVSMEECKKIEKVLRKNNISYFERWKLHTGLLRFLNKCHSLVNIFFLNDKNAKCDILVHMDSFERAKALLAAGGVMDESVSEHKDSKNSKNK